MTFTAWRRWVGLSLVRERSRTVLSVLSVGAGVASVLFFIGLGAGLTALVEERLFPSDALLLEVIPPAVSVSLLGPSRLDEAAVARLGHLPGVKAVHRKMAVRAPAYSRFSGDFFGTHLRLGVEVAAVGLEPSFVAGDVAPERFVDGGPGAPLPALVARRLLELYNRVFAPSRKLPQLSPAMLQGFAFPVEFNRSLLMPTSSGESVSAQVEVLAFSDRVPIASIAIPLSAARRINRAAGLDAESYSALVLEAASPAAVPGLARAVREMGWALDDSERKLAEAVGTAVAAITSALMLLGLLVCALAFLNIAYARAAAVEAGQRELAVMRAVGATQRDIRALVLGHAAVLGVLGSVLGVGGAVAGARAVEVLAAHTRPELASIAGALFRWPAWVWVGALILGVGGAVAGAWIPSRRAARIEPLRVLAAG